MLGSKKNPSKPKRVFCSNVFGESCGSLFHITMVTLGFFNRALALRNARSASPEPG